MIKVGITGGIGSGKSTVCGMFHEMGIPVFDSDSRAKLIMTDSSDVRLRISQLLGCDAYINGELNRSFISGKVFGNPRMLQQLNEIVHPAVAADFLQWTACQSSPYVIMECAILFESGFDKIVDRTVTVSAPEHLRIERAMLRDGSSEQAITDRIRNQMSDSRREALADFTIDNTSLDLTRLRVGQLDKIFRT